MKTSWAKKAVAAGAAYQVEVKGKPGHGLRLPFHHTAIALIEGMIEAKENEAKAHQAAGKKDLEQAATDYQSFLQELAAQMSPP